MVNKDDYNRHVGRLLSGGAQGSNFQDAEGVASEAPKALRQRRRRRSPLHAGVVYDTAI